MSEKLKKYAHVKSLKEFVFEIIEKGHHDINRVKNQITILKKIGNYQNIIRFYGFTKGEGDKYYLVGGTIVSTSIYITSTGLHYVILPGIIKKDISIKLSTLKP